MVSNYIFINTIDVNERDVEHELQKRPYVTDINPTIVENTAMADPLFKNYNIVIKVDGESIEDIKKIVETEINSIPGVKQTKIYSKPNLK